MTTPTSAPLRAQLILGSVREGRRGEGVARWAYQEVARDERFQWELLDLRDWLLPHYDAPGSPVSLKGNFANEVARRWVRKVGEADAYLVVTPEYNHGYPSVLKNALDHAYLEWNRKPISFVSYGGGSGGIRAVEQLRLVAVELQMAPLRDAVHIPYVGRAFDDMGAPTDPNVARQLATVLDQLHWWAAALRRAR